MPSIKGKKHTGGSQKRIAGSERKISGSEQSSDPDPLTRNNHCAECAKRLLHIFSEKVHPLMVESCCIQQIFIELPEIAGIESSDFLKAEKAVNHKDQPLRIVIYPKTNIPLPTILCYWNFSRLYISKSYSSVSFHPTASISVHSFQLLCFVFYLPETHLQSLQK